MRMTKGQTAMEYLMTYGWAILIIMVVLAVLFYMGVLNPKLPEQCLFTAGISCVSSKISGGSGNLTLVIGQNTGHTIVITGINCTANLTSSWMSSHIALWPGNPPANVTVPAGTPTTIATTSGSNQIACTDQNGAAYANVTGTQFNGKIYINYTETDTGIQRITVGTYVKSFEA